MLVAPPVMTNCTRTGTARTTVGAVDLRGERLRAGRVVDRRVEGLQFVAESHPDSHTRKSYFALVTTAGTSDGPERVTLTVPRYRRSSRHAVGAVGLNTTYAHTPAPPRTFVARTRNEHPMPRPGASASPACVLLGMDTTADQLNARSDSRRSTAGVGRVRRGGPSSSTSTRRPSWPAPRCCCRSSRRRPSSRPRTRVCIPASCRWRRCSRPAVRRRRRSSRRAVLAREAVRARSRRRVRQRGQVARKGRPGAAAVVTDLGVVAIRQAAARGRRLPRRRRVQKLAPSLGATAPTAVPTGRRTACSAPAGSGSVGRGETW